MNYPGQFYGVGWSTLWNIWRPRKLTIAERNAMQLYRKRAQQADEYLQRLMKNPFK